MMKRLIFIITMLMAVTVQAQTACIVVEDSAYASRGRDSVIANMVVEHLGYAIHWHDIDNSKAEAWFDTFKVVIVVGSEVASPSPLSNLSTATTVGMVTIGQASYSITKLGDGTLSANTSAGKFKNLAPDNWIMRVMPDTIRMYTETSVNQYSIRIPDSAATDVRVLLIGTTYMTDTSRCMMAAADVGDDLINTTGGAADTATDRRVFCGFWQNQSDGPDSCALWTLMIRSIAWAAGDTLNDRMMKHICWSGMHELDWNSVMEPGGHANTSYGNYGTIVGMDGGQEKHFAWKINNAALQRKMGSVYRAAVVDTAVLRLGYQSTAFETPSSTWQTSWTLNPIIRYWQVERKNAFHSRTCPNACWTYAWMDTTGGVDTSASWGLGGARQYGVDSRDNHYDSIVINESTPARTFHTIQVDPDSFEVDILDTTINYGWISRVLNYSASTEGTQDYGEQTFSHQGEVNAYTGMRGPTWPQFWVTLSSWSTTVPTPTIAIDAGAYDDDSIVFVGILGQTIASQTVQVTNSAGGALECLSIADDAAWSTIIADDTNTPMTFTMYIPFGSQAVGYRSGTVTVTCADATNSPKTFKIVSLITAATARQAKGAVEIR